MFNQLWQYLFENDLIYPGQSGFWENHPTLTWLLKITDDWYNGLDSNQMAYYFNVLYNFSDRGRSTITQQAWGGGGEHNRAQNKREVNLQCWF